MSANPCKSEATKLRLARSWPGDRHMVVEGQTFEGHRAQPKLLVSAAGGSRRGGKMDLLQRCAVVASKSTKTFI